MNSERTRSVTGVGITSLVLIFVMLCLLTLSVLSLLTARADMRLSRRSAERTLAWYEAENEANDILLEIISCLRERADSHSPESFFSSVQEDLEGQYGISFPEDQQLTYQVSLEEEQLLCVTLELSYEALEDGSYYRILEWRTVSTHEWDSGESLPILNEDTLSDLLTEE